MKKIIALMCLWLLINTITECYLISSDKAFLKFADMVVDDNLKNVIVSDGKTFLIAQMTQVDIGRPDLPIKLFGPVYMDAEELEAVSNWKRRYHIMVEEFGEFQLDYDIQMAKVNQWFQGQLKETQDRKDKEK